MGILLACAFFCCACAKAQPEKPATKIDFVMDTVVEQRWYGPDKEHLTAEVSEMLHTLERQVSPYLPDSEIARLNNAAGVEKVKLSDVVLKMLAESADYSALSSQNGGGFDITIGPVTAEWAITSDHPQVPADDIIAQKLALVNWRDLYIDRTVGEAMLARKGQAVDPGAVAKGYVCDLVADMVEKHPGISGYINAGSSLFCVGEKPDGTPWRFGVRDPNGVQGEYIGTITLPWTDPVSDNTYRMLSASGTYERYFEVDCEKYHHIIDSRVGKPVQNSLISVTILCYNGLATDCLSTDFLTRGVEGVLQCLNDPQYGIIAVDETGVIYISNHIRGIFTKNEQKQAYTIYEEE